MVSLKTNIKKASSLPLALKRGRERGNVMKKIFLLILAISSTMKDAFGCDCRTASKKLGFEHFDLILIGYIIEAETLTSTYKVAVNETIKVSSSDTLIGSTGPCSIWPRVHDTWLLYANYKGGDTISVRQCSNSRIFNNPSNLWSIPEPIGPEDTVLSIIRKQLNYLYEGFALNELYYDILNFRSLENENKLQKLSDQIRFQNKYLVLISVLIVLPILYKNLSNFSK